MDFLISGAVLVSSLAVLAKASHLTIAAIEDLIELTGLSEASAGFVVLSVMTSIPEMIVAVFAILEGVQGISVGDILGSNMFNTGIVIGVMALMGSLERVRSGFLVEMVDILFLSSAIPIILALPFFTEWLFTIAPIIGLTLVGIFTFSIYLMTKERKAPAVDHQVKKKAKMSKKVILVKVLGGIAAVVLAARFAVWAASDIANMLGIPLILMGAKIVAIGTSLPELALDLAAIKRGRIDLAIGDVIGSNLTNITLVLGLVLLFSPFTVNLIIFAEILPFLLITTLVFWRFLVKGGLPKWGGILLILIYVLFQATLTEI